MRKILIPLFLLMSLYSQGQHDRVQDYNYLNWLQTFNTISLDDKWSLHVEYQWRRDQGLKKWQQSLFRTGVNLKLNEQVTLHTGYAWIETFLYGDYPLAAAGTFPEHRIYEQMILKQPVNKWTLLHRFRVEQRWVGKVKPGTDREIEKWNFLHRFRYQFRAQHPVITINNKQLYAAFADELFIGAGKNLGSNIFDQNRIFLLAGYKFNKNISIEGGYFNQTLQQGSRINNKTIMQRNNGWLISSIVNL